jgi:hypothetical protein
MQMLFESSFSFCSQQVTTRLQSGEAASAGGGRRQSDRDAAKQSSRTSWCSPWRTSRDTRRYQPDFQESSLDTDAFLLHTQINVSTPEEDFFFPYQKGFFERKRS